MPNTLQQELANGITKKFKDAIIKKIDKDNYLDIHLPSVHSKKGTHLGINTAKGLIKIVFYCREDQFNEQVLANSKKIEAYAQGLRIKGNPTFNTVEMAIDAAIDFVLEIKRASGNSTFAESNNETNSIAKKKAILKKAAKKKDYKPIEDEEENETEDDSVEESFTSLRVGDKVNSSMFKKSANIIFWFGDLKEKYIKDILYSEEHDKYLILTADKKGNAIDYWDLEAVNSQLTDKYKFEIIEKIEEELEEEVEDEVDEDNENEEQVDEDIPDLEDFDVNEEHVINYICDKIKNGKYLTNLLYINKALDSKGYEVDNHQAYFFDSSVLISDNELEGFLLVNMDGFYSNCMNEDKMQMIFSWSGVNDIEYEEGGDDCSIDIIADQGRLTVKKEGSYSLKILYTFYKYVWETINDKFKDQPIIVWNDVWDMGIKEIGFSAFNDYVTFDVSQEKDEEIEEEEELEEEIDESDDEESEDEEIEEDENEEENTDEEEETISFYIGKPYEKQYLRFQEIADKTGILTNEIKVEPNSKERDELWDIVRVFAERIYQIDTEKNSDKEELNTLCFYNIVALHWCDLMVNDKRFSFTNGRFRRDVLALALCFYARIDRSYDYYDHVKLQFIMPHMQFSVLLWSINSIVNLGQDNLFGMFTQEQGQKAQELFTEMDKKNQASGGYGYVDPRKIPDGHPLKAIWHEVFSLFNNVRIPYQFIRNYISLEIPKRSFLQGLLSGKGNNNPGVNVTLLDADKQKNITYLDQQIAHKQFPSDWNLYDDLALVYIYFASSDGNLSKEEKEKIITLIGEWLGEEDEKKLNQFVNASISKAQTVFNKDNSEERFSFALENIRRHFYVTLDYDAGKTNGQLKLICNDLIQIAETDDLWEDEESRLFELITNEWGVSYKDDNNETENEAEDEDEANDSEDQYNLYLQTNSGNKSAIARYVKELYEISLEEAQKAVADYGQILLCKNTSKESADELVEKVKEITGADVLMYPSDDDPNDTEEE